MLIVSVARRRGLATNPPGRAGVGGKGRAVVDPPRAG
jgi:hypothetical protein